MTMRYDVALIGGGFFGCSIAERLRRYCARVVVLEERDDLLQRASYVNQARVHNGYHYPRSLVTALRSRVNYPHFLRDYADCVDRGFDKYYAVARQFSKVSAAYFERFCRRIGAAIGPAPPGVRQLFSPETVEEVFATEEAAFDAVRLKQKCVAALRQARVEVRLRTAVRRVESDGAAGLRLTCDTPAGPETLRAGHVFNCTYSQLNRVLTASDLPPLALKHELTEVALVEVPAPLKRLGVTVMCGPFFSCMPFPARGLHSFTHVRYTPHCSWVEGPGQPPDARDRALGYPRTSNYPSMVRDAARYLPLLAGCRYRTSLWEVKTVLPVSEGDDGRPILFQRDVGLPNLHCVMGAKLDNVYDVLDAIDSFFQARGLAA